MQFMALTKELFLSIAICIGDPGLELGGVCLGGFILLALPAFLALGPLC